jgi:hypothetical protein
MTIRTFILQRNIDVSGISGTGIVADGIQWHDGMCTIHWRGKHPTDNTHLSIQSVRDIHCHNGATLVVWNDEDDYINHDSFNDDTLIDIRVRADKTFDEILFGNSKEGEYYAGGKHRP